jgi:hypothetical protein
MKTRLFTYFVLLCLSSNWASAQEKETAPATDKPKEGSVKASEPDKPASADPEQRFKTLLTKATLSGRWAPIKDGELGEEKGGDKYMIVGVTRGPGDGWFINAKMKYRDQEFVLPIPVLVKFTGDTAILIVDNLAIPGGSTYSARVMFYERTYSGTWTGGRGGGMLYGVITNEKE